jgi:hypothetical protein
MSQWMPIQACYRVHPRMQLLMPPVAAQGENICDPISPPPHPTNHREDWLQLIVVVLRIVKLPPYAVFPSNRTSINWVNENQQETLCVCFPLYVCSSRGTPKVPRHEKESLFRALGHEASSKSGSAHSSPSLLHRVLSKGHRRKIDAQGLGDVNCSINVAFEPDWLFIIKKYIMYVQPFILC